MALYKGNKRYALSTNNPGNVVPLEVTKDGVYIAPTGVDGYSPVTMKNNNTFIHKGSHTDANGVWHKPEEWDDIESIDLGNRHEVYILYACHLTGYDWCRIQVYGAGTLSWSYGHVNNGVYTLHQNSTETTLTNGENLALYLENLQDDYIVIRIKATSYLAACKFSAWAATTELNCAMPYRYQPALMRYGRMPHCTNFQNSATYYLESDNILDLAKDFQNTTTTITLNSAYDSAYNLQRWRYSGWDLAKNKITTFYGLFLNCYCLCDVPNPINMDGWCTSNTTNIRNLFAECNSLNTRVSVRNWDLTNVIEMSGIFSGCSSIKAIDGLETWNAAPKCNRIESMFSGCRNLTGTLDLSKLYLGNGTATITNMSALFNSCSCIEKINISNMNFSKATQVNNLFAYCNSAKEIIMSNITPISSLCTNTGYLISEATLPELIIDGWDFSGCTTNFLTYCQNSRGLKKLIFRNCIAPTSVTIADTSTPCAYLRYSYTLEYLDVSFVDMSVFSGTQTHSYAFRDITNLIDFYPPQNISKSFNLTNDFNLSHDSLIRVINNLKTVSTTQTLTIGTYNIAKLTSEEKAIATNKGWTLA